MMLSAEALRLAAVRRTALFAAWRRHQIIMYASLERAVEAYKQLVTDQSPWPISFVPKQTYVQTGTKIYMVLSEDQPASSPGAFWSMNTIPSQSHIRERLAVKSSWKKDLSRVVEYQVVKPLPAVIGPVGPQIDHRENRFLPGGGTQGCFDIPEGHTRIEYLKILRVSRIAGGRRDHT